MKPEEIGRRFGIGVRVAGRIAKQRMEETAPPASADGNTPPAARGNNSPAAAPAWSANLPANLAAGLPAKGRVAGQAARAAGRGAAGFLKPFRRVGGILWLEVTGFFFGLFALAFGLNLWRVHQDYLRGPHHQQFLIAAGLTLVFSYLSISAFWRARKR